MKDDVQPVMVPPFGGDGHDEERITMSCPRLAQAPLT